jgi:hypothetical protein
LKRIFQDISKNKIDDLWDVAIEATKQKHGTMLVISDNALDESERLGKQCFPIKPLKLTTSKLLPCCVTGLLEPHEVASIIIATIPNKKANFSTCPIKKVIIFIMINLS